jgi:hypothetical protein
LSPERAELVAAVELRPEKDTEIVHRIGRAVEEMGDWISDLGSGIRHMIDSDIDSMREPQHSR